MEGTVSIDGASPPFNHGGWITFPFFIATMAGLTLAAAGWSNNVVVYLIREFNMKNINAAQIANILNGCINLFPIVAAVVADSYLGSFSVIVISSSLSLLGLILLTLSAILDMLKPPPCETGSSFCQNPSKLQLAILYTSLALASLGAAGTRFTLATMGADQFNNQNHQGVFFNWHFFTFYAATLVSVVGIIYVEDNVSWGLGFGLCVTANLLGLVIFVSGKRYFRLLKPRGSPFTGLACVMVVAFRKRKAALSFKKEDYCHEPRDGGRKTTLRTTPSNNFKFLNRAALLTDGHTDSDGPIMKPWNLCTLQQVEDLKTLIRISPLWSTGILLNTPIAIQMSLIVLQALAMDRHLGSHFQIPAGSMIVFVMITTSVALALIDRFLIPTWQRLTGRTPLPLQRIGLGHTLTISSMVISALVESRRLSMARTHKLNGNSVVPMSTFWLVPQLVAVGVAEAFHFPGQVSLYYQEFPKSLKSSAAAMVAVFIGIAFYLGTAVVDLLRKTTGWLPDGINDGRMDNVYWVLTAIGIANFGYYLVCASLYRYQNVEKVELTDSNYGELNLVV
ncbi:protein NRT1/ PTR FAMILY 2.7-like [Cynara cardunculus var. scolymus]|uniref:Major facilitator superfamily domain, general substrate transporter n=1 Tax=Cynara cardunculus var. scolymus TaxID=59895 RepID=A0A124SGZ2_CYNCS|nr:protein NRT1/ PTR FAMILY 2.7-like [Cynara cardunculus var. scolymus]KVI07903.1 Major facilitator superfamily domain, general substrate transporter [Cynara cardunculus var. scolymus]